MERISFEEDHFTRKADTSARGGLVGLAMRAGLASDEAEASKVLLGFFILLVVGGILISWYWLRTPAPEIPEGYELIDNPGQPPRLDRPVGP